MAYYDVYANVTRRQCVGRFRSLYDSEMEVENAAQRRQIPPGAPNDPVISAEIVEVVEAPDDPWGLDQ